MIDQRLTQKQLQKLSPMQIQVMKLLQVPTASLEQRIQEELEANPALEEVKSDDTEEELYGSETAENEDESNAEDADGDGEETDPIEEASLDDYLEDYLDDDDTIASYKLQANNHSPDQEEKSTPMAVEGSFLEYLEEQLGMLDLGPDQVVIAQQLIGSIDDDGYLRREVSAIVDDLAFGRGIVVEETDVLSVLQEIQRFDPPGIGARDLRECLLIQLERRRESDGDTPADIIDTAVRIIRKQFEEFSKKHYDKLMRQLSIDEDELKDALDLILKLNPKPASGYTHGGKSSSGRTQYIVPDFIIQNNGNGELELELNARNAPDLRISDYYRDMLRAYHESPNKGRKEKEAILFIKQKIDSAKWFIDAIRQRQNTMYSTMYAIMQYQRDFFLTGDERKLRPMILRDIAEITSLDISTVSRVANSKYVQTEFGTRRLRDFFSEALQTDSGEEVSTVEVKNILTEIVAGENKRKPVSDEKLKEILSARGYNIARRTVAKYREQLGIPVARLRKKL
jgi:RNA polymerase sigma-54 factor